MRHGPRPMRRSGTPTVAVPEGGVTTLPGTYFAHVAAIGNTPVRAPQRADSGGRVRHIEGVRRRDELRTPVGGEPQVSFRRGRPALPSRSHGYFTGENRDLMALDQARGVVLERLRRSRSPARERVRQCSRRLGLEVRQNVPLGSRRHPSWASRRAGHLVRVADRRVAHRPRDPAGGPEGTGAPLPITRFA